MPKILQGWLENNDGSTVDVSNLLVSPELILNIDLVENDQLSNLLKEKKGIFRALRYEYEAIGRRYQKQLALSDNDYLINLPVNHYVEDIFGPNFIAAPFSLSRVYEKNEPFRNVVIDGFFNPDVLDSVVKDFPTPSEMGGKRFSSVHEKKYGSGTDIHHHVTPLVSDVILALTGELFRNWLLKVTKLKGLIADPLFKGAGLHQSQNGDKLDVHVDFNKLTGHPKLENVERRLNFLLYLNKDWNTDFGGQLEFWRKGDAKPVKKINPEFNRAVLFEASSRSFHGHPNPVSGPRGISRKSLASYYYTKSERKFYDFEGASPRTTEWL